MFFGKAERSISVWQKFGIYAFQMYVQAQHNIIYLLELHSLTLSIFCR